MRLGYGVRVKAWKGRRYVDAWHYEDRDGGRVRVLEYVGPLEDPATEGRVRELMERYGAKAVEESRMRARRVPATAASP